MISNKLDNISGFNRIHSIETMLELNKVQTLWNKALVPESISTFSINVKTLFFLFLFMFMCIYNPNNENVWWKYFSLKNRWNIFIHPYANIYACVIIWNAIIVKTTVIIGVFVALLYCFPLVHFSPCWTHFRIVHIAKSTPIPSLNVFKPAIRTEMKSVLR